VEYTRKKRESANPERNSIKIEMSTSHFPRWSVTAVIRHRA
jgi:hypothetical protein